MKKKTNKRNRPVNKKTLDVKAIIEEATMDNVRRGWILLLGSLSYYYEVDKLFLVQIWNMVNEYSKTFKDNSNSEEHLEYVEKELGLSMPYETLSARDIKTEGHLISFTRKVQKNALYAALSLIAYPMLKQELLEKDIILQTFERAYELLDDIHAKRITYRDLLSVLVDEYSLYLYRDKDGVMLEEVAPGFVLPDTD